MRRASALLAALVLVGCGDRDPTDPVADRPDFAINAAVSGFYVLPPVGSAQSTTEFVGTLSPRVDVCIWGGDLASCQASAVAWFTTSAGTGGAVIQVSTDNVYQVDWDTNATEPGTSLVIGETYQIVMSLQGSLLGTADVTIFDTGQGRNANDVDFALKDGRTLPIRFGITPIAILELVAASVPLPSSGDVFVGTFTTDGGVQTATVPSGEGGFQVDGQNVQIPDGGTEFTLLIVEKELTAEGECEPLYGGPQAGECYVFETLPDGVTFYVGGDPQQPAGIMGVCPDATAVNSGYQIAKSDDGVTTFPDAVAAPFLTCTSDVALNLPTPLRQFAQWLLPRPLYATDTGEGGTVGNFSTGFWAMKIVIQENPDQPLPAGPFAPGQDVALSFKLVSEHHSISVPDGTPVGFSAGGGTLSSASATTLNGIVDVSWTLPSAAATYGLTVSVPDTDAQFEFAASVAPLSGGDLVVFNDVNLFDGTAFGNSNNPILVQNLVAYSHTGPRGSATVVRHDRGRSSRFTTVFTGMDQVFTDAGYTVQEVNSSAGSYGSGIPSDVKVLILWLPTVGFDLAEVNALKQFASEGGRIVFIGEHESYYGSSNITSVQNPLLTNLGAGISGIGGSKDCFQGSSYPDLTSADLGSHQITTDLTGLRMACASVVDLTGDAVPLIFESDDWTADSSSPDCSATACVLAAVDLVDTTPLTALVASASASAPPMLLSTSSSSDTTEVTTYGLPNP